MKQTIKFSEAIAIRLKELCDEHKITPQQLRVNSGVSKNTFKCIMNARYNSVNLIILKDLIRTLDISISEFFNSPLFDDGNLVGD